MKLMMVTLNGTGEMPIHHLQSIMGVMQACEGLQPPMSFAHDYRVLTLKNVAKNYYASLLLERKEFSHLLFLDHRLALSEGLLPSLMEIDQPVVGCVYPTGLSLTEDFYRASRQFDRDQIAKIVTLPYSRFSPVDDKSIGEVVRVSDMALGAALFKRSVFERLLDVYPDLYTPEPGGLYRSLGLKGGVLQCFDALEQDTGLHLSEDASFCRRWCAAGGEIFAMLNAPIGVLAHQVVVGNAYMKAVSGFGGAA